MNEKKKIVTYEPDNSLKKGYLSMFAEISDELIKNKWLTYQLFKRDFLATYKQSLMGFLWAFIIPLISIGTFVLLNKSGVFNLGNNISVPYPIYAIIGMAFWQLFSVGLLTGGNSLVKAGSMIVKINFSKKSLVISSYAQAIIPFMIQLLIGGILFITYGLYPHMKTLFIPLTIIPLLLFTIGLSLILSLLNAVLRDIGNILSILITLLMFLTPVLYTEPRTGILAEITKYNPLYYLVSTPRDLILSGEFSNLSGFLISSFFSIIVFMVCMMIFHITEVRISERV